MIRVTVINTLTSEITVHSNQTGFDVTAIAIRRLGKIHIGKAYYGAHNAVILMLVFCFRLFPVGPPTFQDIILRLQNYWAGHGCVVLQPLDMEVGAGTFHPATFLRALGLEPIRSEDEQSRRRRPQEDYEQSHKWLPSRSRVAAYQR